MSFSNLFKEFKSTATWLQFPFICEAGTPREGTVQMRQERGTGMVWERRPVRKLKGRSGWGSHGCGHETGNRARTQCCGLAGERVGADFGTSPAHLPGVAFPGARWTCLQLDLHDILLVYLQRCYSHLKGVRLCASMLVRSLYTSDLCFDPGEDHSCVSLPPTCFCSLWAALRSVPGIQWKCPCCASFEPPSSRGSHQREWWLGWWPGRTLLAPGIETPGLGEGPGRFPGPGPTLLFTAITVAEARRSKLPVTPIPREMAFPVPKGESWHDRYVHIR